MSTTRRAAALMAASLLLPGCTGWPRLRPLPMDQLHDDRGCPGTVAPTLLVLLPGANMTPDELQAEGFLDAVRARGLAVDVLAAHTHLGLVYEGRVLERLESEVLTPARARGHRRIWLAGISLGGFIALTYAMRHPGRIAGVVLLAPYLGRRPLVQAVAAAGGAAAWRGTARPRDAQDIDHELWQWLSALPPEAPPLYLGYGSDDRFAEGHRLLAELLPPGHVRQVPGGHDWAPWRRLWAEWLDRGLLDASCSG
jgi:pimeloyl-ACP methyl ester carboxylesterase